MNANPQGLQAVDWVIIALYALSTIAIGWYYGRQQRSAQEYFVGSGDMHPVLIGVSLFATLLSTISYLAVPGEAIGKGPTHMAAFLMFPLVYAVVAFGLLPVYMKQRVTSAYELLEERLGLSLRLLGASLFLVLRLIWMSLLIYLASKAMVVMLGIDESRIPIIVCLTGFVAVLYTSIGGLRAVVVTDLLQTILLFSGACMVLIGVTLDHGGFGWIPTGWDPNWDRQPLYSFDPRTRVSVLGTLITMGTWYICTAGGDQTVIQRFMATKDARAARRAYATQLIVSMLVTVTLCLVGFALLDYFKTHSELLPVGFSLKDDADKVFPRFIAYHLPAGISGLVVSAMFAAAMSSVDSGINSITAVVTTDFLHRFKRAPKTERGNILFNKTLAFVIGGIVVAGSAFVGKVPGSMLDITNKTVNLLVSPIFGLFFFALFVPFARPVGVWLGTICGVFTAAIIAFSGPLVTWLELQFNIPVTTFGVELQTTTNSVTGLTTQMAPDPISWQWVGLSALLVDIMVGSLVSWLLPRPA